MEFEDKQYDKQIDEEISKCIKDYNKVLIDFKNLVEYQDYKFMTMIENASENMEKSVSSNELSNNYE